ncbi:hypothetical protein KY285_020169 [Solanum tuberosum]|nr:hypothetical protein KY285_020169 [Solanum tuberosum]
MNSSWLIGGDFNVVLNAKEKIRRLPVEDIDHEDFDCCIETCELSKVQYKGSPFTWWNGRVGSDCIFERLDRIRINQEMGNWFNHIEVEHLPRTGADHAPMFITCEETNPIKRKPFRFLKLWTEHKEYKEVMRQNWVTNTITPFIAFKENIKRVKTGLTRWSKDTYGDIFKQLIIREDIMRIKEKLFEDVPNEINRAVLQKDEAEFKRYLHFEEIYWQQKAGYEWFDNGDRNTRFFYSIVKGRRKRLPLQRIQNRQGVWLEEEEAIVVESNDFYQKQFTQERDATDFPLLRHIPTLINAVENSMLCRMPELEEVKNVVFKLNGDNASGPDGLTGRLYQSCWDIVGTDILAMGMVYQSGVHILTTWLMQMIPSFLPLTDNYSLNRIVETLQEYQGMSRGHFPLKYLGCPITHARKRKEHYADLIKRVKDKLQAWKEVQGCHSLDDIEVFLKDSGWNYNIMQDYLPNHIVDHVRQSMSRVRQSNQMDKPWWIKSSTGKFTVKSAWEILRSRDEVFEDFKRIWVKGLPFKISFFGWRGSVRETIGHLFLSGEVATYIWDHYARVAGILVPWVQVKYTMKKWWVAQGNTRLRMVFQAVPNIILWFLWKRRNTILHGGVYIRNKVQTCGSF